MNETKYLCNSNYATWMQIALPCILKLKMFKMTLQVMVKRHSTHQIMNQNAIALEHNYPGVKIKEWLD